EAEAPDSGEAYTEADDQFIAQMESENADDSYLKDFEEGRGVDDTDKFVQQAHGEWEQGRGDAERVQPIRDAMVQGLQHELAFNAEDYGWGAANASKDEGGTYWGTGT